MENKDKKKRYLAIDGGGAKGLVSAVYLSYIEYQTGVPVSKCFDIIAGSSSGGILATILSLPKDEDLIKPSSERTPKFTAFDALTLYKNTANEIFSADFLFSLKNLWGLLGPRYDSSKLDKLFDELADVYAKDLLTEVVMTAYNLEDQSPETFNNKRPADGELKVKEMALATSAAPTFFKPHRINGRGLFVDGAVYAPTPANWLLMGIERLVSSGATNLAEELEKTTLVSIGTSSLDPYNSTKYDGAEGWGLVKWLLAIFGVFDDGMGDVIDSQSRRLLGDNHFRINVKVADEQDYPLDLKDRRKTLILYNKTKESIIKPDFQDIKKLVLKLKKDLHEEGLLPEDRSVEGLIPFEEWEKEADKAFGK